MLTITRLLEFDAGHRIMEHESKCATLHGHRYRVEVTAHADALDPLGRVVDFSVIKDRVGKWLDDNWDHTCIINKRDESVVAALSALPSHKPVWVADWNPTAENIADHLLRVVCPGLLGDTGVVVTRVRVWETPNCHAEATL